MLALMVRKSGAFLIIITLLSSCALSKAIYLGQNDYAYRPGLQAPAGNAGDINGIFPQAVYIKTKTQTFNSYHYYILREGLIWYKSIDPAKEPENWTLFTKTGLPRNPLKLGFNRPKQIVELSADADELVALSGEGGFYRYCFDRTIAHKSNVWLDRQGWPNAEQLFFDRRTAKNISWALGKRNDHVLYYEDPFGNQHHNGTMEIATTYVLLEDGQEICYADAGLPPDFSRNYIGPERGTFKAAALSASGSTMFVINSSGEMYTRLADFDTTGCDPMLFKYTYVPYESTLPGTNYFSNLNDWGLPAEDWRPQAPIPLSGKAAITRHITILQNGQGNGARELRVAGLNEAGRTGYWTKAIFGDTWEFKPVLLYLRRDVFLKTAASEDGGPRTDRRPSLDKSYSGYYWSDRENKEQGWEYTIPNFNMLEGYCDFQITRQGETCVLKLHPVEMWTYLKRDYVPGRTGSPKMFLATLEIPENAFDGLSAACTMELTQKYAEYDKNPFRYFIAASSHFIFMGETHNMKAGLYLTDGSISDYYPEFPASWQVEPIEELQRYYSPALTIDGNAAITKEDLVEKIELNRAFRDELRYTIRTLKWAKLTTFKISAVYMPVHYFALITPLCFVDVPKIRTITRFGDRIVLANRSYIHTTSNIRIWVYETIIEALKARLIYYKELVQKLSEMPSPMRRSRARAQGSFTALSLLLTPAPPG
jgi:hypothetical protein